MFSQDNNFTQRCALCGGTDFFKEAGYYFCNKCQTQNEDVREEVYEGRYDATTRLKKTKIRTQKFEKTDITGWTSWELYNLVLIGLTNELIEIGADPSIKLTVLQLWSYYLSKLEVAFTSKKSKNIPKMSRRFHRRDIEIIYGKIRQRKKKKQKKQSSRTSASSLVSSFVSDQSVSTRDLNRSKKLMIKTEYDSYLKSQASSDIEVQSSLNQSLHSLKSSVSQESSSRVRIRFNKKAKQESQKIKVLSKKIPHGQRIRYKEKYVTSQYSSGPDVITPMKLWSIVYLALRIENQDICLSDMLRFSREGHLSCYRLDHLIPPEVSLTKSDINFLTQCNDFTHKRLRLTIANMAKFLNVNEIVKPDICKLIKRYCEDLNLPKGIFLYAQRTFFSSPSIMNFDEKSSTIPNYEGRAIAYIIVVMKVLFGLDDITEKEISRVVEKINRTASEKRMLSSKLFSFCEWQKYIECRKSVLVNLHFPTKIKYDPECSRTPHLYLRFMGWLKSKHDAEPPEIINKIRVIPQHLVTSMFRCVDELNNESNLLKEMELFAPSFTPLRSYVDQLIDNPNHDLPYFLRANFYEYKVGYVTSTDNLLELASQCGIQLDVVDRSLKFFEKIVPPFEQPRMPSLAELSKLVDVVEPDLEDKSNDEQKKENLLDYSHRHRMCVLRVNFENLRYYNAICDKTLDLEETLDFEEDSCFDKILSDGRLNIPEGSESEDEETLNQLKKDESTWTESKCLLDQVFCKEYNIQLYKHEIESLKNNKELSVKKYVRLRDPVTGKFIKSTSRSIRNFRRVKIEPTESSEEEILPEPKKKSTKKIKKSKSEVEVVDKCFDLPDSDISILEDQEDVTILHDFSVNENEILFRPYRDYWMYHCIFSRVKGKNFELFEKELPDNFLWLLNECAEIVEMTSEDLYEEVCLIEAYHLNILKPKKPKDSNVEFRDCTAKVYINSIMKKW